MSIRVYARINLTITKIFPFPRINIIKSTSKKKLNTLLNTLELLYTLLLIILLSILLLSTDYNYLNKFIEIPNNKGELIKYITDTCRYDNIDYCITNCTTD